MTPSCFADYSSAVYLFVTSLYT